MFYKRYFLQNVVKFTEKVPEPVFNKVKLAILFKKDSDTGVSCEFFKIIKSNFFVKHLRASASKC